MNKIKVLHTEWSDGWGGQEIRIINEMIAVREQGVEVFLACRENAVIAKKATEHGIKVFVLPFRGNTDFKTLFSLRKIIVENNIDIVNTHSGKDTWVGGIAAKLAGAKFVRTRHLSNKIGTSRLNFINELADFIMTTGESVKNDMIENNRIKPAKITSIPTGIDEKLFNPELFNKLESRSFFNIDEEATLIGIIAVLRSFKRHDRFLDLAKKIISKYSEKNIKFVIAGDGPRRDKIEKQIADYELSDNIYMLGHVSDVPKLLSALDIFVLTSDSNEGVPQSVMQALLMNKAVISTDAGSTKDLFFKDNFILVDKDKESELFEACSSLIEDENKINEYGERSRNFIVENFSKTVMTNRILNIYKGMK